MYIFVLSLIAASLIIKPKINPYAKYHKIFIFLLGFGIMIISQVSFKFISKSMLLDFIVIIAPLLLIFFYYFILIIKTNLKIDKL